MKCPTCQITTYGRYCHECGQPNQEVKIDVNASVCQIDGAAADGAYPLITRNATVTDWCHQLRDLLDSNDWGMEGIPTEQCFLRISIGPVGSGDNLPM